MKSKRAVRTMRSNRGTTLIDLAIACMVIIGFAITALDFGGAMMAFGITDRACRDAARAAAQGSSSAEAKRLATAVIKSYANTSGVLSSPQVDTVTFNDFGGHPPDGVSPFVTVTTSARATVLAPLNLFGHDLLSGNFPMRKTYTFPIVKLDVRS